MNKKFNLKKKLNNWIFGEKIFNKNSKIFNI